ERILAHHERLELLDERLAVQMRAAHRRAEEGMALYAVVRLDGDQPELAGAGEATCVPPVRGRGNAAPAEQRERDVGDLHETVPFRRARGDRSARPKTTPARRRAGALLHWRRVEQSARVLRRERPDSERAASAASSAEAVSAGSSRRWRGPHLAGSG